MTKLQAIANAKQFRQEADALLQRMKACKAELIASGKELQAEDHGEVIAQTTIATRDLESSIMRLGMVLKNIGTPDPYPASRDPSSPVVEPTADGLKL